jgi:4-hydroxy-tetrahydrodipicolinate synthase
VTSSFRPSGVFVPVVTPFAPDGSVDLDGLARLAQGLIGDGARGLVALATTGEAHSLDEHERRQVVDVLSAVCAEREAPLIVGAGTNDTRTTIDRHSTLADVPAVRASLAVVPYYVRPSEAAVVKHFQLIAERSPVPVIIYNIPYRTGRGLGADALIELAATDNIAGVKQAVGSLDADTLRLLAQTRDHFAVLGGDDAFLYPLALMGATGAIAASAHLCTSLFVQMIDAGIAGSPDGRATAEALLPVVSALFAEPSPAVLKAALHAQGRIATPSVRMPLDGASPDGLRRITAALAAVGD